MSVQAMTRVMESSQAHGMTRFVLLVIANHETEDRGAFPAIERLAKECGCGVRTVQDAITRAKKMGELSVEYRAGPHGTNIYRTLCGSRGAAPLPVTATRESAGVQMPHPADSRQESAPNKKELRVTGSVVGLASSGGPTQDQELKARNTAAKENPAEPKPNTRPTEDQTYLAQRITETWGATPRNLGPAALQKLNTQFGVERVASALRLLHGFPPEQAVESPYAYVSAICEQEPA
jgi:hypothetical protein